MTIATGTLDLGPILMLGRRGYRHRGRAPVGLPSDQPRDPEPCIWATRPQASSFLQFLVPRPERRLGSASTDPQGKSKMMLGMWTALLSESATISSEQLASEIAAIEEIESALDGRSGDLTGRR
jgi:hypothetical protein